MNTSVFLCRHGTVEKGSACCKVDTQVVLCTSQSPEKSSTAKTVPLSPGGSESLQKVGQFPHSQYNPLWRRLLHRGVLGNDPT